MKRAQRHWNANYDIRTVYRIKSKSPPRKRGWPPTRSQSRKSDIYSSRSDPGSDSSPRDNGNSDTDGSTSATDQSSPLSLSPGLEVTSANLHRWLEEEDFGALDDAVLEGYGDRVLSKAQFEGKNSIQSYVNDSLPKTMNKIRSIHAAVACGDVICLQDMLDKNGYALAKDHLGMAPLHKSAILGHVDVVQFILEKFPETINAKDRDGRTALHYAAATTNRNGARIYKMLVRAGADSRIRDSNGKTAEYYRVHLLPLPSELSRLSQNSKRKIPFSEGLSPLFRRRPILLPSVQEKITGALHDGDVQQLFEHVLEGHGDAILGRCSWGEGARKFVRGLPHLMDSIKTLHAAIVAGDLDTVQRIMSTDANLTRSKDENGLLPIHIATYYNQLDIVDYLARTFPNSVTLRDHFGRTALHIAAQNKSADIYRKLVVHGADPKAFDLRGKTAENYFKIPLLSDLHMTKYTTGYRSDSDLSSSKCSTASKTTPPSPTLKTAKSVMDITEEPDLGLELFKPPRRPVEQIPELATETAESAKCAEAEQKEEELENGPKANQEPEIANEAEEATLEPDTVPTPVGDDCGSSSAEQPADENSSNASNNNNNAETTKRARSLLKMRPKNKFPLRSTQARRDSRTVQPSALPDKFATRTVSHPVEGQQKEGSDRKKGQLKKSSTLNMSTSVVRDEKTDEKLDTDDGGVRRGVKFMSKQKAIPEQVITAEDQVNQIAGEIVASVAAEAIQTVFKNSSQSNAEEEDLSRQDIEEAPKAEIDNQIVEDENEDIQDEERTQKTSAMNGPNEAEEKGDRGEQLAASDSDADGGKIAAATAAEADLQQTREEEIGAKENETEERLIKSEEATEGDANQDVDETMQLKRETNSAKLSAGKADAQADNPSADSEAEVKELDSVPEDDELARNSNQSAAESETKNNLDAAKETQSQDGDEINQEAESNKETDDGGQANSETEEPPEALQDGAKKEDDEENGSKEEEGSEGGAPTSEVPQSAKSSARSYRSQRSTGTVVAAVEDKDENNELIDGANKEEEPKESISNDNPPAGDDIEATAKEEEEEADEANAPGDGEHDKSEQNIEENQDQPDASDNAGDQEEVPEDAGPEGGKEGDEGEPEDKGDGKDREDENEQKKDDNEENANSNEATEEDGHETTTNRGDDKEAEKVLTPEKSDDAQVNSTSSSTSSKTVSAKSRRTVRTDGTASTAASTDDRLNELIDSWIRDGDLLRLEHVVIAGQGERLVGKKCPENKAVEDFLELVPAYMDKIKSVHEAVVRGNFKEVRQVLTRKRFALSRDHQGASPLHLAVLHAHLEVLVFVVTSFPETIDGPDNEGRTPLHYAAVVGARNDGGARGSGDAGVDTNQYYEILKKAGASDKMLDKAGHSPSYYLSHPGDLTIRQLLENYRSVPANNREQSSTPKSPSNKEEEEDVDVWHRPPTADIESRLTPSPESSEVDANDKTVRTQEVSADVHVDGDKHAAALTPTPSQKAKEGEEDAKEIETMSNQFKEALRLEKNRLQGNIEKMLEKAPSLGPESLDDADSLPPSSVGSAAQDTSSYDLCQVKDESGRTILHLAAAKVQRPSTFYKMLSQCSYLIAERDVNYMTVRGVAVSSNIKENVQTIDKFILDEFVKKNVAFVQMLSHEGFDISNVVDEDGQDATTLLERCNLPAMIRLLTDTAYFQKSKDELHTFIKNDYLEGVLGAISSDPAIITAKNRRGKCALHICILFGNIEIVEALVRQNANSVHVQDNLGRTPLHYAMATSKVEEIGKLLIQAGANRQIRDVRMRTPSYYFVYSEEIREVKKEEQALS